VLVPFAYARFCMMFVLLGCWLPCWPVGCPAGLLVSLLNLLVQFFLVFLVAHNLPVAERGASLLMAVAAACEFPATICGLSHPAGLLVGSGRFAAPSPASHLLSLQLAAQE
jgi:hypothetical protein